MIPVLNQFRAQRLSAQETSRSSFGNLNILWVNGQSLLCLPIIHEALFTYIAMTPEAVTLPLLRGSTILEAALE